MSDEMVGYWALGRTMRLQQDLQAVQRGHADAVAVANEWAAHAQSLEAQVQELTQQLIQWQAHAAGLEAQVGMLRDELLQRGPSQALANSGRAYTRGNRAGQQKTNARLAYEQVHDQKARQLGASNPVSLRAED